MTTKQKRVLAALEGMVLSPGGMPVSVRQLADEMESPNNHASKFSYDEVLGQLRALERMGLVQQLRGRPKRWTVVLDG